MAVKVGLNHNPFMPEEFMWALVIWIDIILTLTLLTQAFHTIKAHEIVCPFVDVMLFQTLFKSLGPNQLYYVVCLYL